MIVLSVSQWAVVDSPISRIIFINGCTKSTLADVLITWQHLYYKLENIYKWMRLNENFLSSRMYVYVYILEPIVDDGA